MNAILRHSVFPRSCSFQVENTSLKLDEYVEISQLMESSIITWAIIMCTFRILLTCLVMERIQEEIC